MKPILIGLALACGLAFSGCQGTTDRAFDPQDANGAAAGGRGGALGTGGSPTASSASSGTGTSTGSTSSSNVTASTGTTSSSGSTGSGSTGSGSTGGASLSSSGASTGNSGTSGPLSTVTTLAGNGTAAFADGTGGPSGAAEFHNPEDLALDASGNVYVADTENNRIRKVDPSGTVTTLAGNGTQGFADGTGGPNGTAEFFYPEGVVVDSSGNVYVADTGNTRIRKIDPSGNVTTLAGNGIYAFADGTGGPSGTAEFASPAGVAVDATGNVYVADTQNNRIRKIDPSGNVTTLAGNGTRGFADGTGGLNGTAEFSNPVCVTVGPSGDVYVAEGGDRIRKIDGSANVTTLAGNGVSGFADGTGGPSGTAEFAFPSGVAADATGNVYVADSNNARIRKIDPSGNVTTLAGNGNVGFVDGSGGPNGTSEFDNPNGVAVDASGNVYVADSDNNRIRKIVP